MDPNIVFLDLRRGIPEEDASADAVYHSHLLEHLDRDRVPAFLADVRRVLRPGGIQRIVVPDLERQCRDYLEDLDACLAGASRAEKHESFIGTIVDQLVRLEAHGTSLQSPVRRFLENAVLGDAQRRGETHRWMYDRVSLPELLRDAGFRDVRVMSWTESAIPGWETIGLDIDDGAEYKPDSLYLEATK